MYCRHCGKEIEKDSKFCPYCGMEVTKGKVEETIPEAGEKQQQKIQGKKKNSVGHVLKRFIVGTFAAVGILVVALAIVVMAYPTDDVEEQNGKTVAELSVTPTPTVTPAPVATNTPVPATTDTPASAATNTPVPTATNTPAPTATNTPVPTATATPKPTATSTPTPEPTKVPAIEDMELEVSVGQIEVGETSEEIKVKVIENGFTGDWTLTYSIEDNTIAKCRWGEWEADNVSPLFVGARGKGETTIKVSIKDTEIYKEIKVICNVSTLPHEPSKEDMELVPSVKTVEVGEYPEIVYIDVYRYGYTDSFSLSFYSDDITIADAKWDTGTKENDLIIFTKKEGETTIHVYVVGTKNVVADIKVISNGASLRVTPTPEATVTPKPTVTPEATATPKPTEKPAATATPTPTASSGSTSSYTATDSSGTLEMSVKPGFASTVTRETKYAGAAETAKLLLPDLEAWSEGKFVRSEVTEHDTYTVLYYHAPTLNKEDSMAMLEKYYELLENYDIYTNVTTTSYLSTGYYEWQDMDYTGNVSITENAATSYDELPCDLSGWYSYEGFGDIAYGIEYPKEIGFGDTGERYGGTQASVEKTETLQNTSMPEYTVTESGLDSFKITGWGWDATDYVEICLHPDLYEKGDVFTLKEFAAQADAGSGKLNSFTVRSVHIGRKDWLYENVISPNKEHKHMFDSIRVEIVEKSETVTVIHYAVKLRNAYGDDYVLEGLFAVKTGEETPASSSSSERESVSVGIGEVRCTSCRGTGVRENSCIRCRSKGEIDCSYCSGDGEVDCTKCGGDGQVWDALNGENARCSSCYGSGDKRCTKCNGTGDVDCTSCGGKGYTESQCSICLGKGKY